MRPLFFKPPRKALWAEPRQGEKRPRQAEKTGRRDRPKIPGVIGTCERGMEREMARRNDDYPPKAKAVVPDRRRG